MKKQLYYIHEGKAYQCGEKACYVCHKCQELNRPAIIELAIDEVFRFCRSCAPEKYFEWEKGITDYVHRHQKAVGAYFKDKKMWVPSSMHAQGPDHIPFSQFPGLPGNEGHTENAEDEIPPPTHFYKYKGKEWPVWVFDSVEDQDLFWNASDTGKLGGGLFANCNCNKCYYYMRDGGDRYPFQRSCPSCDPTNWRVNDRAKIRGRNAVPTSPALPGPKGHVVIPHLKGCPQWLFEAGKHCSCDKIYEKAYKLGVRWCWSWSLKEYTRELRAIKLEIDDVDYSKWHDTDWD